MKKFKDFQITDEKYYCSRRQFIRKSGLLGLGTIALSTSRLYAQNKEDGISLKDYHKSDYGAGLDPHSYEEITGYNNFYEFGTGKDDPARRAHSLKTYPWSIVVSGECAKPGVYNLEDFVNPHRLEERVYKLRCVEAWSMVIPWLGVSLASVVRHFEPTSKAKYVVFKTLYDPQQMPGQLAPVLDWPYIEGLTIAEAMHPLSFLAVGVYGRTLPNQNGAPLRLVVPWKYGFKSIKSIVSVHFQDVEPTNSWQKQAPKEYGFYANVNPNVDHPRWSQARERVIGKGGFFSPMRIPTELFNGYGEEVGHLYAGLDLKKNF